LTSFRTSSARLLNKVRDAIVDFLGAIPGAARKAYQATSKATVDTCKVIYKTAGEITEGVREKLEAAPGAIKNAACASVAMAKAAPGAIKKHAVAAGHAVRSSAPVVIRATAKAIKATPATLVAGARAFAHAVPAGVNAVRSSASAAMRGSVRIGRKVGECSMSALEAIPSLLTATGRTLTDTATSFVKKLHRAPQATAKAALNCCNQAERLSILLWDRGQESVSKMVTLAEEVPQIVRAVGKLSRAAGKGAARVAVGVTKCAPRIAAASGYALFASTKFLVLGLLPFR
jgi:hypothetical protein